MEARRTLKTYSGPGERYQGSNRKQEQKSEYEAFLFERYFKSGVCNKVLCRAGKAKVSRERKIKRELPVFCLFSFTYASWVNGSVTY